MCGYFRDAILGMEIVKSQEYEVKIEMSTKLAYEDYVKEPR